MSFLKYVIFLVAVLSFSSCSVSKHLKGDARVHTKTNIEIKRSDIIQNIKKTESQSLALTQPKPATGIGKWQTNLYNNLTRKVKKDSTGKEVGIRGWFIRKIGIAPVLFDPRRINTSRLRIAKHFNDNGYFGTVVKVDTVLKNKEVTVNFTVYPKRQYFVRNIFYPKDSTELVQKLFNPNLKSHLTAGMPYDQRALDNERGRLTELANNSGFLNVNKDHFYFFVDTALRSHKVDIHFKLRQPDDESVFKPFRLDQNIVYASYSLSGDQDDKDSTVLDNYRIIQQKKIVRPKVLANIILGEKGDLYSKKQQNNTLTRLLDLGIYKFVNLKIDQIVTDSSYIFNRNFYLTPGLMQDFTAEFEAISRSTSYFGIASTVTYSHKNIFKGAERLGISLSGGIGTQTNKTQKLINTLDAALEVSLTFPRLITPFKFRGNKGIYVPKTRISLGNDYQRRVEYYTVNSFILKYGYDWARTKRSQHQLFPVNINLFIVQDITEAMRDLFLENPRLEKSFRDVFILGLFYNYTFTTQTPNPATPYFYMRTGFETAGNIANLFVSNFVQQQTRPYQIFGAPFSQYVRIDADLRYYWPQKKGVIAARFISGLGFPYINSEVLPYIKQYFIGGPSSIRAFQFRALGPGSFIPPDLDDSNFIEQTGDMRLEANLEYRFPLFSYFKGALFVDAGNIWLMNDTEDNAPEAVFKFDRFYKEIAVGAGLGLRFDLNFMVIRLDTAIPLRKPYLEDGSRWVFSEIDFTNTSWRQNNIQWNFAIGYPF